MRSTGNAAVCRLLIDAGASRWGFNQVGQRPFFIAQRSHAIDVRRVIKPSPSGHLTVKPGNSGSPIRAGMSTPTNKPSQPRRSPRTGGMPPPGQGQARKPWNSRKVGGGGLTPQPGGTKPAKKTLKHSAST